MNFPVAAVPFDRVRVGISYIVMLFIKLQSFVSAKGEKRRKLVEEIVNMGILGSKWKFSNWTDLSKLGVGKKKVSPV